MISLLLLGFVVGMRHALEADHLAAVAALTSRGMSTRHAVRHGAAWGCGHTLTLFGCGAVVLLVDRVIPELLAAYLETIVGLMLILLGVDLLRRVLRERIHYHVHRHDDGRVHLHAHSHAGERGSHRAGSHRHAHAGFPLRALLVGLLHGMAGSAPLILLTLNTVQSFWLGLAYILLFGIGSIAGMAALSVAIAFPLRRAAQKMTRLHNGLQLAVGAMTPGIGSRLVHVATGG